LRKEVQVKRADKNGDTGRKDASQKWGGPLIMEESQGDVRDRYRIE
jgi:hypothetical protein